MMISRLASWALLVAALSLLPQWAAAEVEVPPLKTRVTDLTGTLAADQRAGLEAKLADFETRKGSQVAVLIVPTIQPEAIEQYAIRVFDEWKLGRKGVDDGVLLVIAKNDRKLRIEVGRGLEGVIPDAVAKRIVAEMIAPRFREGDFYGGINAGVDRILRAIEGEPLPPPKPRAQTDRGGDWSQLLFIGLVVVLVVGGFVRSIFGRFLGSGVLGFGAGALGYVLVGTIAAVIVGIIAFLISLLSGSMSGRSGGWSSGHGWGSHGWGSGGGFSSGGGFGGGGFSGGGGDSGGGGASGSW
jgi:uncharacterized protein